MAVIDCAHYSDGERQHEGRLSLEEAQERCGGEDGDFIWLGLADPSREELAEAQQRFGLHPLAIEDAETAHQRPKLEAYGDDWFLVLKTARYDDAREAVEFGEIQLFVGRAYVVVVRHGAANELRAARRHLEQRPHLLDLGPASVVWAVMDKVVDDYEPVAAGIENDIEEVESELFEQGGDQAQRIYFLRRELAGFYRAVHPLLGPLQTLEQGTAFDVPEELRPFFRDIGDHARRVHDDVVMQRELLDGVLNANMAQLGVRQNEQVRTISGWAAIIAVPTLIASMYGMNFEHMPELGWPVGYPLALLLMALLAFLVWRRLRRVGWL